MLHELLVYASILLDLFAFSLWLSNKKFTLLITSQEMTLSKYGKTCILAILSPLAIPNDALAEVCEPDNSLFNMPLLFGIALIGATVGGMVH